MDIEKQEWFVTPIKWQEVYRHMDSKGSHKFITLEHEALVLVDRNTGDYKIVKHTTVNAKKED